MCHLLNFEKRLMKIHVSNYTKSYNRLKIKKCYSLLKLSTKKSMKYMK